MRALKLILLLTLLCLPTFAGTTTLTVTYSPAVAGTPTLSQTLLFALAILLPALAFRAIRKLQLGTPFSALIVAVSLLGLEALTGSRILLRVNAGTLPGLTVASGGTYSFSVAPSSVYPITNNTNVSQRINSISITITPPGSNFPPNPGTTTCTVGTVLAPGQTCNVGTPSLG